MNDASLYAVGIDIGTTKVRCVVGHIDSTTGVPTIIGAAEVPNNGMRKGTVVNLNGPAQAIDSALGEAERMSGHQVDAATISINGSHLLSTATDGMIAVGGSGHEIGDEDVARIEEVATLGKIPANRVVVEVVPHDYRLDGQSNIKDPRGMTGTRLEVSANVVSVMAPSMTNLQKAVEMASVGPRAIIPAVLAAARAVLTEQQMENGVAVVDIGGATTSVAVYEEGDLQHLAVIPRGGIDITNDLAIGLKTDPEIAEKVKLQHGYAGKERANEAVQLKHDSETLAFDTELIDEVIEARLEQIFELVNKELKKIGRASKLPSGVVLVGGSAKMKGIADYAKESLGLAAKLGKPAGYGGVAEHTEEPQYATAIGLMLMDIEGETTPGAKVSHAPGGNIVKGASGLVKNILDRFKI